MRSTTLLDAMAAPIALAAPSLWGGGLIKSEFAKYGAVASELSNPMKVTVTNLSYVLKAIDAILKFISTSGTPYGFTIAPINEASDNFAGFATAAGLTTNGTDWINIYIDGVLSPVAKVDKRIPLMLQDCFSSERLWSPSYDAGTNIVLDSHIYVFAAAGICADYVAPAICEQA